MSTKKVRISAVLIAFSTTQLVAFAGPEEDELVRAAKFLKPISDTQWNEIVGTKISDTYEVHKGDTLWSISNSLFGNSFYWPKVWSFNNATIGNPHLIEPGQKLAFSPGTSASLPTLQTGAGTPSQANAAGVSADAVAKEERRHKHEYDKISPEMWAPEESSLLTAGFDEVGIDDLRIDFDTRFNFRVPSFVNDSTIPSLGEITAARREGASLGTGEVVFIKSSGLDLQVGTSYSVLSAATAIQEKRSDRTGFAYQSLGEVRIIGVKDELYIAEITKGSDVIQRGNKIYPLLPLISDVTPKAARAPIEALTVVDPSVSINNVSQYRFVFFDRGLEDGVEVGDVFRIYDYYDPVTQKKITDSDFLISADALVVHATAQFSTALVIRARSTVSQGDFGVALTDVTDLQRKQKRVTKSIDDSEQEGDKELDELDELDRGAGEGLGKKEEAEIKELDYWDKTKDLEPTVPSDASNPDEGLDDGLAPESTDAAPSTDQMDTAPLEPLPDESSPAEEPPPLDDSLDSGMAPFDDTAPLEAPAE